MLRVANMCGNAWEDKWTTIQKIRHEKLFVSK